MVEAGIKEKRRVLAQAVRGEMKRRGWLQQDLARASGLSSGTVSNIVNGQVDASAATIGALARALGWGEDGIERLYYGELNDERRLLIDQVTHELRGLALADLELVRRLVQAAIDGLRERAGQSSGDGRGGIGADRH